MLEETDEIVIYHGPSLSALIYHSIIAASECPDIHRMKVQIQTMLGRALNYSSFISIIILQKQVKSKREWLPFFFFAISIGMGLFISGYDQ